MRNRGRGGEGVGAGRVFLAFPDSSIRNPHSAILMKQPNVTVYGSQTCPRTTQARQFLDGKQIPYEYRDVDDTPEYNDYVAGLNGGKRVIPTIRVDNETLINPSEEDLARTIEQSAEERR